jgi:hypothetical protein
VRAFSGTFTFTHRCPESGAFPVPDLIISRFSSLYRYIDHLPGVERFRQIPGCQGFRRSAGVKSLPPSLPLAIKSKHLHGRFIRVSIFPTPARSARQSAGGGGTQSGAISRQDKPKSATATWCYFLRILRAAKPAPTSPVPRRSSVAGSGTVLLWVKDWSTPEIVAELPPVSPRANTCMSLLTLIV